MVKLSYLLCFLSLIGAGRVAGQQNLFNIPASVITVKSKVFFQQQVNFSKDLLLMNTTFCWGLGGEAEIGVNILGVHVNTGNTGPFFRTNSDLMKPPVYPYYTVNFQKAFTLNKILKVAIGTQAGFSKGFHFGSYTYTNLVTFLHHSHSKFITGLYHGTETILGPGDRNPLFPSEMDRIGFQFGFEQQVIKEKLLLIAEHISGAHSLGITAVGTVYYVTHYWSISSGYQFANSGNSNPSSVVLEVTYVPSK